MKDSFIKFKEKTKRDNEKKFKITWYFASLFSKPCSYIFYRFGFNANQVTILFFIVGLIGAFMILLNTPLFIIISYLLFRLHLIFDLSDGDLARYYKSYSVKGAYMDYMIHSILYPLYTINVSIICYMNFSNTKFLFFGLALSFLQSLILASKNTYLRAFHQSKVNTESKSNIFNSDLSKIKSYIINISADILSIEGFLFGFMFLYIIDIEYLLIPFFFIYVIVFTILFITKTYLSLNNKSYKKN
jgi:hypothetical protein